MMELGIISLSYTQWRDANFRLYQSSNRVISGIVQNWYLSEGRTLEAQSRMRPIIAVAIVIGLLLLLGVVIFLVRNFRLGFDIVEVIVMFDQP